MIASVELVVAALATGAAAGTRETASTAVKDAYSGAKTRALRTLRRAEPVPSAMVEAVETDAITTADDEAGVSQRRELAAALTAADAGADDELVAAALKVLELADRAGSQVEKYRVLLHGNKGVQVGDGNIQNNTFN